MIWPAPEMLWEDTNPGTALHQRLGFESPEQACQWLTSMVTAHYNMNVRAVTRLVISSANLLGWLDTTAGPTIAKCRRTRFGHQRLRAVATLTAWLAENQLPVAAPLAAKNGQYQVRCGQLTLNVQPVLPGDLLDPSNLLQAAAAGVTLARLHHALAHYPGTRDFAPLCLPVTSWNKHCGRQLVHHDFRAANILWNQDGITAVLDLEEICWGRRVDDLAWAAVHLGTRYRHWSPVAPTVHTAFLNAYDTHLPLTAAEQVDLPVLLARYTRQLQHT